MNTNKSYIIVAIFVVIAGVALGRATDAIAQPLCMADCGKFCSRIQLRIAVITHFTGHLAGVGQKHKEGAYLALRQINDQGGKAQLVYYDGEGSPNRTFINARKALQKDRSNVVIGVFGKALVEQLASANSGVLFFDLGVGWSPDSSSEFSNVFTLSNQLKESSDRSRKAINISRCPKNEIALQTYIVMQLIAEAVKRTETDKIRTIIESLRQDQFHTALGKISLSGNSNVFVPR